MVADCWVLSAFPQIFGVFCGKRVKKMPVTQETTASFDPTGKLDIQLPPAFNGKMEVKYTIPYNHNYSHTPVTTPEVIVTDSYGKSETVELSHTALYVPHDKITNKSMGIYHSLDQAIRHIKEYIKITFTDDMQQADRFEILKIKCDNVVEDWCGEVIWESSSSQ